MTLDDTTRARLEELCKEWEHFRNLDPGRDKTIKDCAMAIRAILAPSPAPSIYERVGPLEVGKGGSLIAALTGKALSSWTMPHEDFLEAATTIRALWNAALARDARACEHHHTVVNCIYYDGNPVARWCTKCGAMSDRYLRHQGDLLWRLPGAAKGDA